jgi:hypothetical protein
MLKMGGSLSMDPICLGVVKFIHADKFSKLFRLIPKGPNLPLVSDIPQKKILRGNRPRRTRSCGISDPADLGLAGYQTPQNNYRDVHIL